MVHPWPQRCLDLVSKFLLDAAQQAVGLEVALPLSDQHGIVKAALDDGAG